MALLILIGPLGDVVRWAPRCLLRQDREQQRKHDHAVTKVSSFQNECRTPWTRDPITSTTISRRNASNTVTSSYSHCARAGCASDGLDVDHAIRATVVSHVPTDAGVRWSG